MRGKEKGLGGGGAEKGKNGRIRKAGKIVSGIWKNDEKHDNNDEKNYNNDNDDDFQNNDTNYSLQTYGVA